jgi:hypothetical protein
MAFEAGCRRIQHVEDAVWCMEECSSFSHCLPPDQGRRQRGGIYAQFGLQRRPRGVSHFAGRPTTQGYQQQPRSTARWLQARQHLFPSCPLVAPLVNSEWPCAAGRQQGEQEAFDRPLRIVPVRIMYSIARFKPLTLYGSDPHAELEDVAPLEIEDLGVKPGIGDFFLEIRAGRLAPQDDQYPLPLRLNSFALENRLTKNTS